MSFRSTFSAPSLSLASVAVLFGIGYVYHVTMGGYLGGELKWDNQTINQINPSIHLALGLFRSPKDKLALSADKSNRQLYLEIFSMKNVR